MKKTSECQCVTNVGPNCNAMNEMSQCVVSRSSRNNQSLKTARTKATLDLKGNGKSNHISGISITLLKKFESRIWNYVTKNYSINFKNQVRQVLRYVKILNEIC